MRTTLKNGLGGVRYRQFALLLLFVASLTVSVLGVLLPARPASAAPADYAQIFNYPPGDYNYQTIETGGNADGSSVFVGAQNNPDGYWWGVNYVQGQQANGGTLKCPLDYIKINGAPQNGATTQYYRFQFDDKGTAITDARVLAETKACRDAGIQYTINPAYNPANGKLQPVTQKGGGADKGGEQVGTDGAPQQEGQGEEANVCEDEGGKLAFIFCFIIDQMFNAFQQVQQQAVKYLHFTLIAPDNEFGLPQAQYNNAKSSWLFISRLANAFLAIAFLVMIIGTAMSDFLDAYSVKKILPRLIIAIIGVNLSWYLCTFILEVGNVLGAGIREIILSPFGSAQNNPLITLAVPGGAAGDWVSVVAGGAGGLAALFVPGLGGFIMLTLFSILVPALMTILLGFVLIIARQGLLLLLTIISPLAIALWVLPGTEGLFKRWQRLFLTMVMFYPIFQAILAIGVVIAIITTAKG